MDETIAKKPRVKFISFRFAPDGELYALDNRGKLWRRTFLSYRFGWVHVEGPGEPE
jgi:hypothetical protein